MITRDDIANGIVATLQGAATLAQGRVYTPRDWPTWSGVYPVLVVRTPRESKASIGRVGPPTFTSTVSVEVVGRLEANNEASANEMVRILGQQIENAILRNGQMIHDYEIQQFSSVEVELGVTAEGKQHIGDVKFLFAVELFQVYEPNVDANGVQLANPDNTNPGTPLENVQIHLDMASPFDPTGTYTGSEFPQEVTPAPRTTGPDGRDEGALDITLPQ